MRASQNTPARNDVSVGIIGVGAMGLPIVQRLLEQGMAVTGFDVDPARLDVPTGRFHAAASPRAVADGADIVLGCLPSNETFRAAVLGPDGARGGRRMSCYVHLGTSGVDLVEELSAALAPDVPLVDAPVIGGAPRAREGALTVVVSGDEGSIGMCRPVLEAIGSNVFVVSERPGTAQLMKLVNNIMSSTNLAIACEALLVGARAGLDARAMLDVVNSGTGQSDATLTKIPHNLLTGRFDYGGALRIILKDSKEFLDQADRLGVPVDLARKAREAYVLAAEMLGDGADMTEVIRPLETAAGAALRG